eukprot:CAMPEP_0195079138 /NCGR_PEP_ID=MMETSP0448-20130528/21143_1 /TAXON_ID=66468 /ORGANISM="Heterocapsa triquestra, Strain CCMP 448" /LENGTH=61 /DNA_ID=CAMNT_0040111945 /DNA_START=59 /DNA_END=241 /DNA_ORIENTATION=+
MRTPAMAVSLRSLADTLPVSGACGSPPVAACAARGNATQTRLDRIMRQVAIASGGTSCKAG